MSGAEKVVKEGFLTKSPPQERLMAQWHRRYFVLWSGRLMEYYTSKEKRPQDYRKTIDLNSCEDMVAPLPIQNRPFVFKLSINQGGNKTRDYYFDCGSEYEMENWVKCLATLCGFSAVEETDVSPLSPEAENSLTSSLTIDKPKLRPPLPPSKTLSSLSPPPPMVEEVLYEDPLLILNKQPTKLEDSVEEVYDNIDDVNATRDLNKFPPPVWKQANGLEPPPLPPSHPARRYTRSFEQSSEFVEVDEWRASRVPVEAWSTSKKPMAVGENAKHVNKFGSRRDSPRMPKHRPKSKPPTPPVKPSKSGSSDDILNMSDRFHGGGTITGRGMGFNLKSDPKFNKKLQEKRQEVYGDVPGNSRPRSWGHDLEAYEEVPFTASDDDMLDGGEEAAGGRRTAQGMSSSDEEYVDCQPHDDDDAPPSYLEHDRRPARKCGKGENTLKREEFLRRPPLPLPPRSSSGNPLPKSPPAKVPPAAATSAIGAGGSRPPFGGGKRLAYPPMVSPTGSDPPPPVPKRGNERPPMPIPGTVVDDDDGNEAPPIPRRHPNASDKHRTFNSTSPSRQLSMAENVIPLPPRSLSPHYPSPVSIDSGPPLPQRGPRQVDSPSPSPSGTTHSKKARAPPPILKKHRSLSPEDLSSPASASSDHAFEKFLFGQGPPSLPSTPPQTRKNRAKPNSPVLTKKPGLGLGVVQSYETKLPADIGVRLPKKKPVNSYEANVPPSMGNNRPPPQTAKKPETAASSSANRTKPKPPTKPPVAAKPKSPPHVAVKPQVSKKPGSSGQYPSTYPRVNPPTLTPKPVVETTNSRSWINHESKGGTDNGILDSRRTLNGGSYNTQPVNAVRIIKNGAAASKPPVPTGKPKPLPPRTVDRRKPLPTPGY